MDRPKPRRIALPVHVFLAGGALVDFELYHEKISYSAPITNKTIALRKNAGVEVRVLSTANKAPIRVLMLGASIPGNESDIALWVPLDRDGVGALLTALAGSTLTIPSPGARTQ